MSNPTAPTTAPNAILPPGTYASNIIVPFIVSSGITGALIVIWAFFASSLLGFLVGWLVKLLFKSKGMVVTFDSINIAPLSGTIALKNIVFVNQNFSVRAVDGFIRVRWWLQHVKRTLDDGKASRVQVELNGLDVQIYNNVGKYDQLRRALSRTRGTSATGSDPLLDESQLGTDGDEVVNLDDLIPVQDYKIPFFNLLSPVVKIVVHKGSLMAGNPLIQSLLSVSFHSARIKYTVEQATHPSLDYFKMRVRADLSHVTARITDNVLYLDKKNPSGSISQPQTTQTKAPRQTGFWKFLKAFNFGFLSSSNLPIDENAPIDEDNIPLAVDTETEDTKQQNTPFTIFGRRRYHQLRKQQEALSASTAPLLTAPSLRIEYFTDSAGPFQNTPITMSNNSEEASMDSLSEADPSEPDLEAPQQGVIVTAPTAVINFGPDANRHRAVIQAFFLPSIPEFNEVPIQRQFNYFDIDVQLLNTASVRIPFRTADSAVPTPSASAHVPTSAERQENTTNILTADGYEWLEIRSGPLSISHRAPLSSRLLNKMQIKIEPDWVDSKTLKSAFESATSESSSGSSSDRTMAKGYEMDAMTDKNDPRVLLISSLHPKETWMHVSSINVDLTVETPESPLLDASHWTIDVNVADSCIFFLREHADLFSRLGQDFAMQPDQFSAKTYGESLANFRPTNYELNLRLIDQFALHLNLNERNIVNEISNMRTNNYYSFMGPKLHSTVGVALTAFQPAYLPVSFEAIAVDLAVIANYADRSTMQHLFEPSNEDELSNFLFARHLRLDGGFQFATGHGIILPKLPNMDPEQLIDYLDLHFEASHVKGKAVGSHLNLFDRFLDNYVGAFTKATRSSSMSPPVSPAASAPASPQTSPRPNSTSELTRRMEISITVKVHHPTVSLPLNLYNDQMVAVAKCKEVQVDVRAGTELSLAVGVSPITIYLPACGCTVVTKPMATLSHLSVELLYRKASIQDEFEKRLDVAYRQFFKVNLGDIKLAVEPVQVLRALDGVQEMFYTLFNRDNRPDYLPQISNPYDQLKHFTLFLSLNSVDAKVWGPRGVIQATLNDGMKLAIDNLLTPRHGEYIRLRIPNIRVAILTLANPTHTKPLSSEQLPETEEWIESASFLVPKVIIRNVAVIADPSQSLHVKQLEFLRRCDKSRHQLLPYLWQDEKAIWSTEPSSRPWIKNFFDSASPVSSSRSLPDRIFTKIPAPDPSAPSTPRTPRTDGLMRAAHSQPLRRVGSKTASNWKSLSRPAGPVSPIVHMERTAIASLSSLRAKASGQQPSGRSPRLLHPHRTSSTFSLTMAPSSSDSEFSTAHSSDDVSESDSPRAEPSAPSPGELPHTSPHKGLAKPASKVQFSLPISEATNTIPVPAKLEEMPLDSIEVPSGALLDHFRYDILGTSIFTETDQLGEFQLAWSPEYELCEDLNILPSSHAFDLSDHIMVQPKAPKATEVPKDGSTRLKPPVERKHTKKNSSPSASHSRQGSRRSTREEPSSESHSFRVPPAAPDDMPEMEQDPTQEAQSSGTLIVTLPEHVDAHLTPVSIVVLADALENVVRERLTVQTMLDRLQLSLVSQMIVNTENEGVLKLQAVMLQVAGARLNLLQTHIGEIPTNYITSLSLGKVTFSMKSSQIRTSPVTYANVRYALPALVDNTKSRDMALTISTFSLSVEQLSAEYMKDLLASNHAASTRLRTELVESLEDPVASAPPSGGISGQGSDETSSTPATPNSRAIFSAKLLEPLDFLYRFVAPSCLATHESATNVKVGKVQGAMHEEFGAYVAAMIRAWTPSFGTLTTAVAGLSEKSRLAQLVLYELLVQLRDIDVNHEPYAAYGRSSEAQRTAWMLIYVTRQRLMGSSVRGLASENRFTAGQVGNTTIVSVDSVRAFEASFGHLHPHHMPPLLAGCIDLDFFLHDILSKDPDIIGSHFLVNELFLQRAQTTRQRFNVHIQGLAIKIPSIPHSTALPEDLTRSAIVLLPVDVSALTKVSVRLPPSETAPRASSSPPPGATMSPPPRKFTSSAVEDLFLSSSDPMNASHTPLTNLRVLAPVTVSETQFLVNSKGVKIYLTPKALDIGQTALKRWKASEAKKHHFDVRSIHRLTSVPVRFALLEQMVDVSPDIFNIPSRDRHAISGHLVSDAFSVRAISHFGTLSLDIPETSLTLSSLPESANGHRQASHTVILRLPVLNFAANIERRKRMATALGIPSEAPIRINLSQLAACVMFTPSGIFVVEGEEIRGGSAQYLHHRRTSSSRRNTRSNMPSPMHSMPSSPNSTLRTDKEVMMYDALDVVVQMNSFTLPFKMPHPIYAQSFLAEWMLMLGPTQAKQPADSKIIPISPSMASSSTRNALSHLPPVIELKSKLSRRSLGTSAEESEKPVLPFLTRKVRATFHAHLENIVLEFTQLQDLPVKYEIPELSILSRHAEYEHALRVAVKSHLISFEPKKSKVSVDSENFDFVSTRVTKFELPSWTIESTVRQRLLESEQPDAQTSASNSKAGAKGKQMRNKKPEIQTDIQSSVSVQYIQNVLRANVIKNILVFQATMRREIDSVIAILEEAKKKSNPLPEADAPSSPSSAPSKDALAFFRMWPNVRWRIDVDCKGVEVQVESPHATIMLYSGHLRAAASSMKRTGMAALPNGTLPTDSETHTKKKKKKKDKRKMPESSSSAGAKSPPLQTVHNPFELRVTLDHITALLCPPDTKGRIYNKTIDSTETGKLDVWAGLSTNLAIQTFADQKFEFKYSGAAQRGAFKSWWILLKDTHVLIQPWVGEKALLMWLYFSEYHATIVSRKNPADQPLDLTSRVGSTPNLLGPQSASGGVGTSATEAEGDDSGDMMLGGTDATIFVQISVVGVLVPCNSIIEATSRLPLTIATDPRFNLNSALLVRLEQFTFSGSTRSVGHQRGGALFHPGASTKPKRTQILANAVVKGLSAGFDCLEYEKLTLSLEDDRLYKQPVMNHVAMSEADCRFVFVRESRPQQTSLRSASSQLRRYGPSSVIGAVELTTSGLKLKLNAQLYSHVAILAKCVELGQLQFNSILDELNRQQLKEESSKEATATPLRRPRGGTVSVRGPGLVDHLVRAGPTPHGATGPILAPLQPKSQHQSTFQLDVSLITTAGAIEFYSCTSASKADTSGESLKSKVKGRKAELVPIVPVISAPEMSDSDGGESLASTGLFKGSNTTIASSWNQNSYTLLLTVPLPQVKASFSKLYRSRSATLSGALSRPTGPLPPNASPNASTSSATTVLQPSKRINSNTITVAIESVNSVISPDLVIFYHELLAQISVMKLALKDLEKDESEEEDIDDNKSAEANLTDSSPNLFSKPEEGSPSKVVSDSTANVPQQADKEEAWTIHFHLQPSSLTLTSTPYSDTTCAFKTGDIIILYQSAFVKPENNKEPTHGANGANDGKSNGSPLRSSSGPLQRATAFQRSLLLDIGSLGLTMEHPHLDKDTNLASLEIVSLRLHGSHTELSSAGSQTSANASSNSPTVSNPLTLLLTVQSSKGFFSIRHLQETLLFVSVWQQGIYLSQYSDFFGTNLTSSTGGQNSTTGSEGLSGEDDDIGQGLGGVNDSSESSTASSATLAGGSTNIGVLGLLLEESSILLNVELHQLSFISDLGPSLASVDCKVDYVIGSASAPGRSKLDPLGEIFDLVLQAGPFDVVFRGTLDGSIQLPLIALHGQRVLSADPTKPIVHRAIIAGPGKRRGASPLSKTGMIYDRPNLVGRSIWTGKISPMNVRLNYSLSPVLTMNSGHITVAAYDSWRQKERDEDDDDDLDDDSHDQAQRWEAVTNINAQLGNVDLAVSSETISLPTNVAKRLIDSIRKSNDKAKTTLKSMDQLLVVRRDLRKMKYKAGVGLKPLERLQHLKSLANSAHKSSSFRTGSAGASDAPSAHLRSGTSQHKVGPTGTPAFSSTTAPIGRNLGSMPPNGSNDIAHPNEKPERRKKVAIGEVKFTGSSLNVRMFSFSLRDPNWLDLTLTSFQIGLNQRVSKLDLSDDSGMGEGFGNGPSGRSTLSGSSGSVIRRSSQSMTDSALDSSTSVSSSVLITVSQELSFVVGGASLAKIIESRSLELYNQSEQITESIFIIPATTLVQYSSQDVGSHEIEIYFMATFSDAIRVAIKLNLYTELKDTVASYQRAIDASKNAIILPPRIIPARNDSIGQNRGATSGALRTSRKKAPSTSAHSRVSSGTAALPVPGGTNNVARTPKITISKPVTGIAAATAQPIADPKKSPLKDATSNEASKGEEKKEQERIFTIKKFDFDPSIDVLGDFTPRVATVLGWLGINNGEQTIPKAVHNITDVLESTLTQARTISRLIARRRMRWKDYTLHSTAPKGVSISANAADIH